ncbi:hypothetical protein KC326_g188 [Hortaea werneckii]|nr:hypothetical protein KC326_g188 [Hortaea werneckii]
MVLSWDLRRRSRHGAQDCTSFKSSVRNFPAMKCMQLAHGGESHGTALPYLLPQEWREWRCFWISEKDATSVIPTMTILSLQILMNPSTGPPQTTKNRFGLDAVCLIKRTLGGKARLLCTPFNLPDPKPKHTLNLGSPRSPISRASRVSAGVSICSHLMSPRFSVAPNLVLCVSTCYIVPFLRESGHRLHGRTGRWLSIASTPSEGKTHLLSLLKLSYNLRFNAFISSLNCSLALSTFCFFLPLSASSSGLSSPLPLGLWVLLSAKLRFRLPPSIQPLIPPTRPMA